MHNNNAVGGNFQSSYTVVEQKFTLNVTVNNIFMGDLGEIGWYLRIDSVHADKLRTAIGGSTALNDLSNNNLRRPTAQQKEKVK